MATITLEANENFEHYHSDKSISELIFGDLVYESNAETIIMKAGEKIFTDANIPHAIRNVGKTIATFKCSHHHDEF
jgi:quercetin dioxygenase-like cupin family protein